MVFSGASCMLKQLQYLTLQTNVVITLKAPMRRPWLTKFLPVNTCKNNELQELMHLFRDFSMTSMDAILKITNLFHEICFHADFWAWYHTVHFQWLLIGLVKQLLLKAWVFFILPSEKLQTLIIINKNYKEQQQLTIIILFTEVEVKRQVYCSRLCKYPPLFTQTPRWIIIIVLVYTTQIE